MNNPRLVRHIYHRGVIVCNLDTPLHEVARMMADLGIHAVMVVDRDDGPPVGVVSHTDIIAHYGDDLTKIHARKVMTPEVVSIHESDSIELAARTLLESGFNRLLVVSDEGKPLGILSTTDVIREMRNVRQTWCFH